VNRTCRAPQACQCGIGVKCQRIAPNQPANAHGGDACIAPEDKDGGWAQVHTRVGSRRIASGEGQPVPN